jgi:predicted O-methyltransferase YrrM
MTAWNPVIARLEADEARLKAHWSLPREDARLLYLLARLGGFQRMLEVGTSIGYSTLHLALAASRQYGRVTTIDASADRQSQAADHLKEAGLAQFTTFITGDALTVLAELEHAGQPFDLIFLDARKSEYISYLDFAEKVLSPGGLLVADNTRSHRPQMADFIERITRSPLWETCDMETPNGFVLARRLEIDAVVG